MSLLTIKKCGTLSCNGVWWLNSTSSISTVFTNGRVLAVTWWAAPLPDMRVNSDHRPIYWMDMIKPPRSKLEVWTRGFKDGAKTINIYIYYIYYIYILYICIKTSHYFGSEDQSIVFPYYLCVIFDWLNYPKKRFTVTKDAQSLISLIVPYPSLKGCMCKCHWNPGCQFFSQVFKGVPILLLHFHLGSQVLSGETHLMNPRAPMPSKRGWSMLKNIQTYSNVYVLSLV